MVQALSNGSIRRRAMVSFSPRAAAETCSSISPRSNAPALVLSQTVEYEIVSNRGKESADNLKVR